MNKIIKNAENTIAFLISGLLALLFGFSSPLHPWISAESGTDSSVFKTVALMMEHGFMPYKDSFDHKGPFLYILNWIGNRISQYSGIWVVEIVAIGVAFFVLYKIARMSCGIIASTITALTSISLLFVYYEGGNLAEEYAMPCIAVGIYFFLEYLINNTISKARVIISGICFGIVLLLRPNMVTVWLIYCLTITTLLLWKKSINECVVFSIWFSAGVAVILIPVIIWLGVNNDLYYFIHDYLFFNIQYTIAEGKVLFSSKWNSFFYFYNSSVYIIAFFSMVFHLKSEVRIISISYMFYLILTIVFMIISGRSYGHYGMVLIPAVVYPISLVFSDIEKITDANTSKVLLIVISLYLLSTNIIPNWIGIIAGIATKYEVKDENHLNEVTIKITNMIENYTIETDLISVYGNWDVIYVLSNRMHATRYSYQFPIGQIMPEIMDEYMDGLQEELPKAIIIRPGNFDENIQAFLEKNDYKIQYSSNAEELNNSAMLYLRQ